MNRGWRYSATGLLVFAFISLLGHICALPHVDVVEAAAPDAHHHRDDSGQDTDAAHLDSCEAIRPVSTTASVPVAGLARGVVVAPVTPHVNVALSTPVVLSASPPPLYLLTAALRI